MPHFRPLVALFALALTLSVLFGGWMVYRSYGIVKPVQDALSHLPYVAAVHISPNDTAHSVEVALKPVNDLGAAYREILKIVQRYMGAGTAISITDQRSNALSTLYENEQPMIFEAIAKKNYTELVRQIAADSRHFGVQGKVTMDQNNIYIQLKKGENYLYDVVPYRDRSQEVITQ
jgi:hypothetical protein